MAINARPKHKNNSSLVIRQEGGLTYGDPRIPEWAMKEMEKDMGLPVHEELSVKLETELNETSGDDPKCTVTSIDSQDTNTSLPVDVDASVVTNTVIKWEEFYPENREEAKKLPLIQEHPWLLNGKITNVVLKALKRVQRTHDRPDEHKSLCYHGEYGRYNIMYESLTDTVNDFYDLLHLDNEEIRKRFKMIIKNFTSSPELLELLIQSPLMRLFTIVHPDVIRIYGPENVESYMYSFN